MTRRLAAPGLALTAALLGACGGGGPLLHPAHTLPSGEVAFTAGTSGRFGLGGLHSAERKLDDSVAVQGGATTPDERAGFAAGAIARFAVGPGVAPFAAARVGLGQQNEAGLSWTGRGVRLDGRHAFEWRHYAVSLGLAATGALARPGDLPSDHVDDSTATAAGRGLRSAKLTSLSGYGLELPLLFGYRSDADVVKLWAGLRGGFEQDSFQFRLVEWPDDAFGASGHATRFWGGGLVGFSVGLAPVEVRVEVNAAYENARGKLRVHGGDLSGEAAGLSLTPAMGISAKF
ncbi:MAG: hypothetical protein EOO73_20105 [Myxococcales bacterium]|nr:MAG: hypothetical protein EOO73_20105 [Myxococcales bacterium]